MFLQNIENAKYLTRRFDPIMDDIFSDEEDEEVIFYNAITLRRSPRRLNFDPMSRKIS